jgi:hypothetical protein
LFRPIPFLRISAPRFEPDNAIHEAGAATWCPLDSLWPEWNFFQLPNVINMLQGMFHHDCVLFVQHISENGLNRAFVRRSVVACAELFMDVDRATEGGIPRSSR